MTQEETANMINDIFTRLSEDERKTSEVCVKLDMVVEQMKTSTQVTDKFLEAIEKRRLEDEAREAKFWRALYIIGGALIALALGKDPVKQWAQHMWPDHTVPTMQAAIPLNNDKLYRYFSGQSNTPPTC